MAEQPMPDRVLTTGLPGLDAVLQGIQPGDNCVWQVDAINDYRALVRPFVEAALRDRRRVVYFRFADHPPLIEPDPRIKWHDLNPDDGFEHFVLSVHGVIESIGRGGVYVFDCLSDLAKAWQADQMLGNFYVLTCPRLFALACVAYFAIHRHSHACYAMDPITNCAQFLLDVFRHRERLYIRPIKIQRRAAGAMDTLYIWDHERLLPIANSAQIADILASSRWPGLRRDPRRGTWRRIFDDAEAVSQAVRAGTATADDAARMFRRLCRMLLSRDALMLAMIERYLRLEDLVRIRDRLIGIGRIGGKAVGMLLARAILEQEDPRFRDLLEKHDSFYIGTDVFYTFLVRNGIWWLCRRRRDADTLLDDLDEARQRILSGDFPDYTQQQFMAMLDYFGESPYIVRSSSLLEDNFGNAFAGKYESVFCVNQGSRETRLAAMLDAIRQVYASAMSENALVYRQRRGLLGQDEQMALLVMRVSGVSDGDVYLPHVAGVGFSYNPYVWHPDIDPHAGVVRLVFGLGTRAVDRSDDDYTRVVALNAPTIRPETNFDAVCEYAQQRADYLDLNNNRLTSGEVEGLFEGHPDMPVNLLSTADNGVDDGASHRVLTFDPVLRQTPLVHDFRTMLSLLEGAYGCPVDIEFTVNFIADGCYRIHLLQCRPLQVLGLDQADMPSVTVASCDRLIEARGAVIGHSRILSVDRLIYVSPEGYAALPRERRYETARVIGRINRASPPDACIVLLGPGRWGTSSPELGIPVTFAEIKQVAVLCEIVSMHANLVPDVSLGTHFLNEIVEMNMLYAALFPRRETDFFDAAYFERAPNCLPELLPDDAGWADLIHVLDIPSFLPTGERIMLRAQAMEQSLSVFRARG